MGIFNIGGMAGTFQIPKTSFLDKVKVGLSDFEQTYKQYPPVNSIDKTTPINYAASPVKKSNTTILLIGGGIAVIMAIMLLK